MLANANEPHCEVGPDKCFGCRVRYWRREGTPISIPNHFKAANADGYTQRELANETIAAAKADGREIERVR